MSVAKKQTDERTLGSNAARKARCPPRHMPVAAMRPLQFGRETRRSTESVASCRSWLVHTAHSSRLALRKIHFIVSCNLFVDLL